ncbi:alpha/beta fold hydrolase [Streptococcus pacificus]|uniref:Alpha/beta fold hydrolase n=1 Tax=Streptococcus pacificus TaxID=2740577 RepID=A0ABS0ZIL5_9STRE|nr:alpha/beta hydrolase [Streptococcus pacificus]MBJ8325832.1 alpha/beta fold hydrolase [Streptococcus pacificus]
MSDNKLFIEERGSHHSQTIIFLHASGSSSRMWQHHVVALENDFHCIVVDLPGHGNSLDVEWTSFDEVTEMIAQIIKERAHGRPHLVGLSLGGGVVLTLLESHADLFERAIVDGMSHRPIKGYWKVIGGVYLISWLKNTRMIANIMRGMMTKDGVPEDECQSFVSDLQHTSNCSFRRAMSQANLLTLDLTFSNPIFFVSGEHDSETMHESHKLLASQNLASECAYYPNKGHAWLFSDVKTHIQLVKYFFKNSSFPEKLKRFD